MTAQRAPLGAFDFNALALRAAEMPCERLATSPRAWRIHLTIKDRITGRARVLQQVVASNTMLTAVIEARARLIGRGLWLWVDATGLHGNPKVTEC